MKSKIKGCTHHSSKVISKFRNGGEVGGIGGGSGVDGSGNRGNGGYGGGTSGNQGGGGLGGGGKGGVGGTGISTGVKTGSMARTPQRAAAKVNVRPTSGPPLKVAPPTTAVVKPKPKPAPTPTPTPNPLSPRKYGSFDAIGGSGILGMKGGPADKPVNRQNYENNVVGGRGVPGYGGGNRGKP